MLPPDPPESWLAQATTIIVDDPMSRWDWVFAGTGAVGAIGSVIAIGFAGFSLRASNRVRAEALAERRRDLADRRLGAFGEIAVLLRSLDEAGRNGQYMELVDFRTRISVLLASHLLIDELPQVAIVCDASRYDAELAGPNAAQWQLDNAAAAVNAFDEIDAAVESQAKQVRALEVASVKK